MNPPLRQQLIEELTLRGYSQHTIRSYANAVRLIAKRYHRSPDEVGFQDLRTLLLERCPAQAADHPAPAAELEPAGRHLQPLRERLHPLRAKVAEQQHRRGRRLLPRLVDRLLPGAALASAAQVLERADQAQEEHGRGSLAGRAPRRLCLRIC